MTNLSQAPQEAVTLRFKYLDSWMNVSGIRFRLVSNGDRDYFLYPYGLLPVIFLHPDLQQPHGGLADWGQQRLVVTPAAVVPALRTTTSDNCCSTICSYRTMPCLSRLGVAGSAGEVTGGEAGTAAPTRRGRGAEPLPHCHAHQGSSHTHRAVPGQTQHSATKSTILFIILNISARMVLLSNRKQCYLYSVYVA